MARKRTFKNVFVKQARGGETELVRGYAEQGGRRRRSTDERSKSRDRTCFVAMPCKEEESESQLTNEARGGRQNLFRAMPCKEEESEAKIRHRQYPKPNYKH